MLGHNNNRGTFWKYKWCVCSWITCSNPRRLLNACSRARYWQMPKLTKKKKRGYWKHLFCFESATGLDKLIWKNVCAIDGGQSRMSGLETILFYSKLFEEGTCSRVSCLVMVSFSSFLIFFISLLTWNSCSCSKCCSNSAFSCWS